MMNIQNICCNQSSDVGAAIDILNTSQRKNSPTGIVLVLDDDGRTIGTVTDGDIRRGISKGYTSTTPISAVMNNNPIYFLNGLSLSEILNELPKELRKRGRRSNRYLSKVLIVDSERRPINIIEYHELWEQKVASHRHIIVVGLGYVGLTMAVVMADAGFVVTGVEQDKRKCHSLSRGVSYVHEKGLQALLEKELQNNLYISAEIPNNGDVYIISVGTPITEDSSGKKIPDMQYLETASINVAKRLQKGNLVILRSTVPMGTTRKTVVPLLEEYSGLRCGKDFHLSFAPERTAEGKALKELRELPQIIGGFNKESIEATAAVFRDLTPVIVRVNSLEEAEMAKLINNSFRDYIFAFSNHMARIAAIYNISIVETINAANKGYVRDPVPLPSPGVGGPCLTKDPYIFAAVAENSSLDSSIFTRGREINEGMHQLLTQRVLKALKEVKKDILDVQIFVLGLAFKGYPETGDVRNSSSVEIAQILKNLGAEVSAYDAVATEEDINNLGFNFESIENGFKNADAVLILNNHKSFEKLDLKYLINTMRINPIILDGWNLFRATDIISIRPSLYLDLSQQLDSFI